MTAPFNFNKRSRREMEDTPSMDVTGHQAVDSAKPGLSQRKFEAETELEVTGKEGPAAARLKRIKSAVEKGSFDKTRNQR